MKQLNRGHKTTATSAGLPSKSPYAHFGAAQQLKNHVAGHNEHGKTSGRETRGGRREEGNGETRRVLYKTAAQTSQVPSLRIDISTMPRTQGEQSTKAYSSMLHAELRAKSALRQRVKRQSVALSNCPQPVNVSYINLCGNSPLHPLKTFQGRLNSGKCLLNGELSKSMVDLAGGHRRAAVNLRASTPLERSNCENRLPPLVPATERGHLQVLENPRSRRTKRSRSRSRGNEKSTICARKTSTSVRSSKTSANTPPDWNTKKRNFAKSWPTLIVPFKIS